jgi:O-antigen/teichoic acid export membrane protein
MKIRIALSLAFVVTGLAGRALIDKMLVAQGGAVAVAQWAQLSSVSDLVTGVSLSGVGTALTVFTAGSMRRDRMLWLKPSLVVGMGLALGMAVVALSVLVAMPASFMPGELWLAMTALMSGLLATAPGLLAAHFLGAGQQERATALTALGFLLPIGLLALGPFGNRAACLLAGQVAFGAGVGAILAFALRSRPKISREDLKALLHFVPAGLMIGIMSPAATAWARMEIADSMSWQAVGQLQAIWRTSDWVTAISAGLLQAYFLPRLGSKMDPIAFQAELRLAAKWALLPAAAALGLLWLALPQVLALLYHAEFGVERQDTILFFLGDLMRIASWVSLFGLFARRATWAIAVGEFLSLPLFALLVSLMRPQFLPEVGVLWLLAYCTYALFNLAVLNRSVKAMPTSSP